MSYQVDLLAINRDDEDPAFSEPYSHLVVFGALVLSSTSAGNWFEWESVPLAAGTYAVTLIGFEYSNRGIVDLLLDGVDTGFSADFYSAGTSIARRTGSITVAADGCYDVRCQVNSKNVASNSYYQTMSMIKLIRTGDV